MLIPYEFYKNRTRFHGVWLACLLLLSLALAAYQMRELFPSRAGEIAALQDQTLALAARDPEAYDALYRDYQERRRLYEEVSLSDDRWETIRFENMVSPVDGYGDASLFRDVEEARNRTENYQTLLNDLLRDAALRLKEERGEDSYMARYYTALLLHYGSLRSLDLGASRTAGWNEYFSLDTPGIFLALAVVSFSCSLFVNDRRAGMSGLLHTAKKGGRPTALAKMAFSAASSAVFSLLFTLTPLCLLALTKTGLSSPSLPLQALDAFQYCPYALTIGQYLILFLLLRSLVFAAVGLLLALAGQVFKTEKAPILLAVLLVLSGAALSRLQVGNKFYFLQKYSILELANVRLLLDQYRGVNLFGRCLNYTGCAVFLLLLLFVLSLLFSLLWQTWEDSPRRRGSASSLTRLLRGVGVEEKRRKGVGTNKFYTCISDEPSGGQTSKTGAFARSRTSRSKTYGMSLFFGEAYKQLFAERGLLLLLCLCLLKGFLSHQTFSVSENRIERAYRSYMAEVEGPLTEEKCQLIEEEDAYIRQCLAEWDVAKNRYQAGELSFEEYEEVQNRYRYASYHKDASTRRVERKNYLLSLQGAHENLAFVYDEGLNRCFSDDLDAAAVLAILFGGCLFAGEYQTKAVLLLRLSKRGRAPVFWAKVRYAVFAALAVFLLFSAVDLFFFTQAYPPAPLDANLLSLPRFASFPTDMSILAYAVVWKLISLAGFLCAFLFAAALSLLLENAAKFLLFGGSVFFLPSALEQTGVPALRFLSFPHYLSPGDFIKNGPACLFCTAAALFTLVMGWRKWNRTLYHSSETRKMQNNR